MDRSRTASKINSVNLQCGTKLANGRSILSILLLAAACNTELDIQASGEDEDDAIQALKTFFQHADNRDTAVNISEADFNLRSGRRPGIDSE